MEYERILANEGIEGLVKAVKKETNIKMYNKIVITIKAYLEEELNK